LALAMQFRTVAKREGELAMPSARPAVDAMKPRVAPRTASYIRPRSAQAPRSRGPSRWWLRLSSPAQQKSERAARDACGGAKDSARDPCPDARGSNAAACVPARQWWCRSLPDTKADLGSLLKSLRAASRWSHAGEYKT